MFEVGRVYKRRDLHADHGGQRQGGISTPKARPYILLFTGGGEAYGYHDGWDENGVFLYSGEGQTGDMEFRGGNRAIREHAKDGKDLYLFEQLGRGEVRYRGCFACPSWESRESKDKAGRPRKTIIFHLVPMDAATPTSPAFTDQSLDELRRRAIEAGTPAGAANRREAKRILYERSEAVRIYVLLRAKGRCEACGKPAPFRRPDGSPYLEPHHTRRRSDGGPDHPCWVAATCPTCHREIHYGEHGEPLNRKLEETLSVLEVQSA